MLEHRGGEGLRVKETEDLLNHVSQILNLEIVLDTSSSKVPKPGTHFSKHRIFVGVGKMRPQRGDRRCRSVGGRGESAATYELEVRLLTRDERHDGQLA